MNLADLIHTCGDQELLLEVYEDDCNREPIYLPDARIEEVAFQEVIRVFPLRGSDEHPSPLLGIIIKSGDPVIPEDLAPHPIPLKAFAKALNADTRRMIIGNVDFDSALVESINVVGDFPANPTISIRVTDTLVKVADISDFFMTTEE